MESRGCLTAGVATLLLRGVRHETSAIITIITTTWIEDN
jgi:hypothetical protein